MRIKNLLIIIAIVAAILLVMRYVRQVKDTRRGYAYASGGRVAVNWLLVIILVGSLIGVGVTSFSNHNSQSAAPTKSSQSSSAVEPASDDDDLGDLMLNFKKTARLNDNGEAKVKFLISPQTKVTIKGHKSGVVIKTFKPSKGEDNVTRSFVFDTAGQYDIIARRGNQKLVKHLKIKGQSKAASSDDSSISSSSISVESSSSVDSSSTVTSQSSSQTSQSTSDDSSSTQTSRSTAGTGSTGGSSRGGYRGGNNYGGGNYGGNRSSNEGSQRSSEATAGGNTETTGIGAITEQPN